MLWFWGLAGAFIFAAGEFLADFYESRPPAERSLRARAYMKFAAAMATGAICAEAFSPWIGHMAWVEAIAKTDDQALLRGVSTLIGLTANSAAPLIVKALNRRIVNRIEGTK